MGTQGQVRFASITDGLSNTIFVGEKHIPRGMMGNGWWDCASYNGDYERCSTRSAGSVYPLTNNLDDPNWLFGSLHTGVVQFCFGDGGVRSLPVTINPSVLGLLANRSDGQVIPDY